MRLAGLAVLLALAAVGTACSGKESPIRGETEALLVDHDDLSLLESDTQDVASALPSSDNTTVAPDAMRFPKTCSSYDSTGLTSGVLHLNGCGAPALRGDLVLRWAVKPLGLHVEVDTQNFFIGATFIRSGSIRADVSASGQDRTMVWSMHVDGTLKSDTTPRSFAIDSFKTLRWTVGVPCITTDGTSTGSVGERKVRATFTGFKLCSGDRCPEPNSHVRIDNLVTNQFIDVRFTPQGHAVIVDVDGKLLPIRPVCAG
jgi:hypothetical protein